MIAMRMIVGGICGRIVDGVFYLICIVLWRLDERHLDDDNLWTVFGSVECSVDDIYISFSDLVSRFCLSLGIYF